MGSKTTPDSPLDLTKYQGKWYEVRRTYNTFQRECAPKTTTAEYTLRADGQTLDVVNRCVTRSGMERVSRGVAWRDERSGDPRQLRVSFFKSLPVSVLRRLGAPFSAPYRVEELHTDYRHRYTRAFVTSGPRLRWELSRARPA